MGGERRHDPAKARAAEEKILRGSRLPFGATWPIYTEGPRLPDHIGSAVLLYLGATHFLLTAAHVVEPHRARPLYLGIAGEVALVGGRFITSAPPASGRREDDPVDLAVIVPETSGWPALPPGAAIGPDDLAPAAPPPGRDFHLLLGYPRTRQPRELRNQSLDCAAIVHVGHAAAPGACRAASYNPEANVLLDFDKGDTYSATGKITASDPYGMSGGGIWHAPDLLTAPSPTVKLAAVAIAWRRRAKNILGTRIGPALALIAREFPDVRPLLNR